MAVNNAVCLSKAVEHPVFNGLSWSICSVADTKEISRDHRTDMFGQTLLGEPVTHISCDRVDLLSSKGFEDRNIGEVTGMNDNAALGKGLVDLLFEGGIAAVEMAV